MIYSRLTISIVAITFIFSLPLLHGQISIYTDLSSTITGTWHAECTLSEDNNNQAYEGTHNYKVSYNYTQWWAGIGLNMDNWGTTSSYDLSAYAYIHLAYKGLSGAEELKIAMRSSTGISPNITIGGLSPAYKKVTIPLSQFTEIDLSDITEINFSIEGVQVAQGDVYIDNIIVDNIPPTPYMGGNAMHTSPDTWKRFFKMSKGINFSNWLEAYWLIPYGTFPETNKYNREMVGNLAGLGFKDIRLPVTFEKIASDIPPYVIPPNHIVWDLIDSVVVWAEQLDMTVVICNHHGDEITDANFNNELPKKQAIWTQIINRYGTLDPERFFFELFNEPTNTINNYNLHTVFEGIIDTIRGLSSDHTLIVGGNGWNSGDGLRNSVTYADPDIIYTYHDYSPYGFTHQGMSWTTPPYLPSITFPAEANNPRDVLALTNNTMQVKNWADTSGVPVMLGEIGVAYSAELTSRCTWIETISQAFDNAGIPWYYWDAITGMDAFGFIQNNTMIPCFAEYLKLGNYDICNLDVTSNNDRGNHSLRSAIACSIDGDTITLMPDIAGDTIHLNSYALSIIQNVLIINESGGELYLTTDFDFPVIMSSEAIIPRFKGISFIVNEVTLPFLIHNIAQFENCNFIVPNNKTLNHTDGIIEIKGTCRIIRN